MRLKIQFSICSLLFFSFLFHLNNGNAQTKSMEFYIKSAPFKMDVFAAPVFNDKQWFIKDFGAVADAKTLCTNAFKLAIEACSASGGGQIIVTPGTWMTGPIQLKSNINLVVQKGAVIQFTSDHTQYPIIKASNTSSNYVPASPIYGYDLNNIAITGEGIIDGAGDSWRPVKKSKLDEKAWQQLIKAGVVSADGNLWWPSKEAMNGENYMKELKSKSIKPTADDYLPARDYLRPYMLFLVNCTNALVDGVTLKNSPKFIFYPNKCSNLIIRNANFYNDWWAQNGDAIDISACENVVIYNTIVNAGDDAICMKSSKGKSDAPSDINLKNIIIANCLVNRGHGGFVIGSNTDGGMKNIYVTDCSFKGTDIGIRVKSNAGRGGNVSDIFIDNIYMENILHEAISFDTYYEDAPAGKSKDSGTTVLRDKTPFFHDFHLKNISCKGAVSAVVINGLPEMPISKLFLENIFIQSNNGFSAANATDISLLNIKIEPKTKMIYELKNVKGFVVKKGDYPKNCKRFLVADKKSSEIKIIETDLRGEEGVVIE